MSDPMLNVQIEDVLSSIRRLVSEDLRASARREQDTRPAAAEEESQADKLVLTPAFRVDPEPQRAPWELATPEAEAAPDETGADAAWEAEVADLRAFVRPAPAADAPAAPAEEIADEAWEEEAALGAGPGPAPGLPDEPGLTADLAMEADARPPLPTLASLEDTLAELEAAVAGLDAGITAGEEGAEDVGGEIKEAAAEAVLPEEDGRPEKADLAGPLPEDAPEGDEAAATEESADAAPGVAPSLRRLHLADARDPAPAVAATPEGAGEEAAEIFSDAEEVFDEAALRGLVAEIIRQELQGELGERITRSVRKLVRREIGRALASRELE